jgi:protocatechuate 3,4-dioxygenase beta subunit
MNKTLLLVALLAPAIPAGAGDCPPTPTMALGTHHRDNVAVQKSDLGRGLAVSGDVLSSRGCIRLGNARVEHWQADAEGMYVDRLRAYQITGVDGRFRFETEWPGLSPPHIHFIATAPGHMPLVTQWLGERPLSAIQMQLVLTPEKQK